MMTSKLYFICGLLALWYLPFCFSFLVLSSFQNNTQASFYIHICVCVCWCICMCLQSENRNVSWQNSLTFLELLHLLLLSVLKGCFTWVVCWLLMMYYFIVVFKIGGYGESFRTSVLTQSCYNFHICHLLSIICSNSQIVNIYSISYVLP